MLLSNYFKIQFTDEYITTDALKAFAEDHLRKLSLAGQSRMLSGLLYETRDVYLQLYGAEADSAIHRAAEENQRLLLYHHKQALLKEMRNLYGFIHYKFHLAPDIIAAFYPMGVQELELLGDAAFDSFLQQFVTALETNRQQFLQVDIAEFELLLELYHRHLSVNGTSATVATDKKFAHLQLCKQLTKNLLAIALNNLGHEEVVGIYFNQALLAGKAQTTDI